MIGEQWGDDTNYGGLMFCHVTEGTAVEYQHTLSKSGGNINPTWVLLDNQSTVDVFSNRRLLNNIRKCDRALEFFLQEDEQLQSSKGTSRDMEKYGSNQEASLTSCPYQRWQKNNGCPTIAPVKRSS